MKVLSDVRFAVRLLRRTPGFSAILLTVIAVGIAATTAMFSIVHSLLLRPLPYPRADELTAILSTRPSQPSGARVAVPDFLALKARAGAFESMCAAGSFAYVLTAPGARPEQLGGAIVSGDFFPMFGGQALRGRLLGPEDDQVGGPRVAVVSARIWRRRFGADPDLVGRTIMLDLVPHTVVGVAPDGFRFASPFSDEADIWTPLAVTHSNYVRATTTYVYAYWVMGRRRSGVALEAAQAELSSIAERLAAERPATNRGVGVVARDLHREIVGSSRTGVWLLFLAVSLLFIMVCANVASLLLTRAGSRRAEMAARAALGASPSRLASQVLTETVVIFLLGATGGSLLAGALIELFASGIVDTGAVTIDIRVDVVALSFGVGVCFFCGLVFGLVPALAIARVEPQTVLKDSAARAGTSRAQRLVRGGLVVAQVAIAFTLLVAAGLTLKALAETTATPLGFDPENLATGWVAPPRAKYADYDRAAALHREVVARVAEQPGVEAVAVNSQMPVGELRSTDPFQIDGRPPFSPEETPVLIRNVVTPGYFQTVRIPLLRGRDFSALDRGDGPLVVIVNLALATRFFPGEDSIGRRIDWRIDPTDPPTFREIVGVVGDVRHLGSSRAAPMDNEGYVPLGQYPIRNMSLIVRSSRAAEVLEELPRWVQAIDPEQDLAQPAAMLDVLAESFKSQRYVALLLGAFAAAALFLSTLGVFGLVTYVTAQRTREIGIRIALGSTPRAVVGLVMKEGIRLLAAGLALGSIGAALVGPILSTRIRGVSAFDLSIHALIPLALLSAGLLASALPAQRAARIPAASAMRSE